MGVYCWENIDAVNYLSEGEKVKDGFETVYPVSLKKGTLKTDVRFLDGMST